MLGVEALALLTAASDVYWAGILTAMGWQACTLCTRHK